MTQLSRKKLISLQLKFWSVLCDTVDGSEQQDVFYEGCGSRSEQSAQNYNRRPCSNEIYREGLDGYCDYQKGEHNTSNDLGVRIFCLC